MPSPPRWTTSCRAHYTSGRSTVTDSGSCSSASRGGPACWAAARRLGSERLAAVVSVAGSARGGERFAKVHLDTEGCVKALDAVPRLWLHGTKDENVVPAISRRHFDSPPSPRLWRGW